MITRSLRKQSLPSTTRPIFFLRGLSMISLTNSFSALLILVLIFAGSGAINTTADASEPAKIDASASKFWVYIGTYTGKNSKGIYLSQLDTKTGEMTQPVLAGETPNPSFLAIHPNRHFLYAVNEIEEYKGKKSGSVTAFSINPKNGLLTQLNQEPSIGTVPCHVIVDKAGKNVLIANYGSGSACVLPLKPNGYLEPASAFVQHTGKGANPSRQEGAHAHSANLDAANHFALVADLGLDKIFVYHYDSDKGTLVPNDPPAADIAPGSGPRHFVFHPSGKFGYGINEMGSTVTAFAYDDKAGLLKTLQTISSIPADYKGDTTTSEIQIAPNGKFLYGSNRGHDSIVIYSIDQNTGMLTLVGHEPTQGKVPRGFGIDPTGGYLIAGNQNSDSVVIFRIDSVTGLLSATGQSLHVGAPVCIEFMPLLP